MNDFYIEYMIKAQIREEVEAYRRRPAGAGRDKHQASRNRIAPTQSPVHLLKRLLRMEL